MAQPAAGYLQLVYSFWAIYGSSYHQTFIKYPAWARFARFPIIIPAERPFQTLDCLLSNCPLWKWFPLLLRSLFAPPFSRRLDLSLSPFPLLSRLCVWLLPKKPLCSFISETSTDWEGFMFGSAVICKKWSYKLAMPLVLLWVRQATAINFRHTACGDTLTPPLRTFPHKGPHFNAFLLKDLQ